MNDMTYIITYEITEGRRLSLVPYSYQLQGAVDIIKKDGGNRLKVYEAKEITGLQLKDMGIDIFGKSEWD